MTLHPFRNRRVQGSRSAEWCDGSGYRRFAEVLGNDELGCTQ